MRMRSTDGIEATRTQTPNNNLVGIQLRPSRHVIKYTAQQPVWRVRIRRISRAICRPWNLADNRRPAARDDLMRALAVVRPIAIKTRQQQHRWDVVTRASLLREARVDWDVLAIGRRAMSVGDDDFVDGGLPERGSLQVDLLLAVEGVPFDVTFVVLVCIIDVGEAGDAVDDGGAAEVVRCFVGLVVADGFLGFLFEVGGDREEGVGVFVCGCVVDVFLVSLAMSNCIYGVFLLTPIKCWKIGSKSSMLPSWKG